MHSRLYHYLENIELTNYRQFNFREKYATVDALAEVTEKLRLSVAKLIKGSFFIDLKTFNTLNYKILLGKVECYGKRGNCYKWFKRYLSYRYQCACISWQLCI